jgi:hypothetical protein
MHSFVISPEDFQALNSPDILIITPDGSIGIEEVRQIQSFLTRKPIQSNQNQVFILDAHLLTLPAQNALLKTLEEPPGSSEIYLVTNQSDLLLPTVLSRVDIKQQIKSSVRIDTKKTEELLARLVKAGVGERLDILDSQTYTRDSLSKFLNDLEQVTHDHISSKREVIINHEAISETRKYLKANCSLKLCLNYLATYLTHRTGLKKDLSNLDQKTVV